jgi:hypothetical protein
LLGIGSAGAIRNIVVEARREVRALVGCKIEGSSDHINPKGDASK